MVEVVPFVFLAGAVIIGTTFIGVIIIWYSAQNILEKNLAFLTSFAAGIFLVTSANLLVESLHEGLDILGLFITVAIGFILIEILSQVIPHAHHHHGIPECSDGHSKIDARRLLVSDAFHNIGDGLLLVPTFLLDITLGFTVAVGIFLHELIQSLAELFVLREAGYSTRKAFTSLLVVSTTIFIGIGIGFLVVEIHTFSTYLFGVSAGGFMYIVMHDLFPDMYHNAQKIGFRKVIISFILGIAIMTLFVTLTPHSHVEATDSNQTDNEVKPIITHTPTTVTFVGDMMFDRYIREKNSSTAYKQVISSELEEVLKKSDIVIGNLEGPITTSDPVAQYNVDDPNHYRFTFDPLVATALQQLGFDAVNIGNNHILNFGSAGLKQTEKILLDSHISYFGSPDNAESIYLYTDSKPYMVVITENEFDSINSTTTVKLIQRYSKENYFSVVFAHWGDEYQSQPNHAQIERAHSYIDAGADVIIGTHPHVIQTKEHYKNKWIYYSLGNFIFDQYFDDRVSCGAIVTITISPNTSNFLEQFVELNQSGQTQLSDCMSEVPLLTNY